VRAAPLRAHRGAAGEEDGGGPALDVRRARLDLRRVAADEGGGLEGVGGNRGDLRPVPYRPRGGAAPVAEQAVRPVAGELVGEHRPRQPVELAVRQRRARARRDHGKQLSAQRFISTKCHLTNLATRTPAATNQDQSGHKQPQAGIHCLFARCLLISQVRATPSGVWR
jgi:hypothetical protein